MTYLGLVKAGYGTLKEIQDLDTPDFLDILEFESIRSDIEHHYEQKAARRNGK